MTEKRYYQRDFEELYYIIDSNVISEKEFDEKEMYNGYTAFEDSMTGEEIVDRLNELNDEIQLLHEINEETINFMYDNFDSNIIFTDRELNDICNEMGWELSEKGIKINQLEKENEQLKQRNNRQYEQLGRLYDLIEQKEWRVLTDIIDDFKKSDEQLQKEWGTYGDVE